MAVQLFFGLHYLATKLVLAELPARAWALLRVGGGAALLLAVAGLSGRRLVRPPAELLSLAGLSILGVVINQLCFIEGLARTTPTHSALINTTIPVGTLLVAVIAGHERFDARRLGAVGVAFVGLLLVVFPGSATSAGATLAGDLLTLINALSYALFLVLSKRRIHGSDTLATTALLMALGSVGMSLLALPALWRVDFAAVSGTTWAVALWIVVFPTAGAYLLTYWALARVESSVVAFFIYLQPLIASGLSMLWLGERPGVAVALGAVLIFAGVYLALGARNG